MREGAETAGGIAKNKFGFNHLRRKRARFSIKGFVGERRQWQTLRRKRTGRPY